MRESLTDLRIFATQPRWIPVIQRLCFVEFRMAAARGICPNHLDPGSPSFSGVQDTEEVARVGAVDAVIRRVRVSRVVDLRKSV